MGRASNICADLCSCGIIAIIRGYDKDNIREIIRSLIKGGISVLEVTMNTEGAASIIKELKDEFGGKALFGAGTVLNGEDALSAFDAGAEFIITPTLNTEVIRLANRHEKPIIAGAMTPTEILTAYESGADFVKVFPAGILGPDYIRQIKGPLPNIPLVAVGGVTLDNAGEFIKAGAVSLGIGGSIIRKDAVEKGDWRSITDLASHFMAKVRGKSRE